MQLVVGRIGRPHGIRGEVTVEVRTDEPEQRFAAGSVLLTDPAAASPSVDVPPTLTIETVRWHQGRPLLLFDGIYDRDLAENLRGVLLLVESDGLAAPDDPDEFNDQDLVGLPVFAPSGDALGSIARIEHAPASDLLVLTKTGGGTALIPFVKAIVTEVDVTGRRVVVDAPGGLLDL